MSSGDAGFLVAAVAIFAIALAVAFYVIRKLGNKPARIAAVLLALAALIAAVPSVIEALKDPPPQYQVVAPADPGPSKGVMGQ